MKGCSCLAYEEKIEELESRLSASIRLREILDQDLEAYKAKVKWQAEMLEGARDIIDTWVPGETVWLADLQAGPRLGDE